MNETAGLIITIDAIDRLDVISYPEVHCSASWARRRLIPARAQRTRNPFRPACSGTCEVSFWRTGQAHQPNVMLRKCSAARAESVEER